MLGDAGLHVVFGKLRGHLSGAYDSLSAVYEGKGEAGWRGDGSLEQPDYSQPGALGAVHGAEALRASYSHSVTGSLSPLLSCLVISLFLFHSHLYPLALFISLYFSFLSYYLFPLYITLYC